MRRRRHTATIGGSVLPGPIYCPRIFTHSHKLMHAVIFARHPPLYIITFVMQIESLGPIYIYLCYVFMHAPRSLCKSAAGATKRTHHASIKSKSAISKFNTHAHVVVAMATQWWEWAFALHHVIEHFPEYLPFEAEVRMRAHSHKRTHTQMHGLQPITIL